MIKNLSTVYCAVLDKNFLARGLVLYESLLKVNDQARFAFFCIDDCTASVLQKLNLDRAIIIKHGDFVNEDLHKIKNSRSRAEFCWTCKPFALLHIINNIEDCDWVIYVDTDMMFFADPDNAIPVKDAHYLIAPHGFHKSLEHYEKSVGKFNAGYVAVKSSAKGSQVLLWWSKRCIESCSAIANDIKYADQKYLDQLPSLFPFGAISANKGLNTAPWNIYNYLISNNGGSIDVDGEPLLLYHFQGLQLFDNGKASLYIGDMRISDVLRSNIYQPHLDALLRAFVKIRETDPTFARGLGKQRKYLGNIAKRIFKMLTKRSNVVPFHIK